MKNQRKFERNEQRTQNPTWMRHAESIAGEPSNPAVMKTVCFLICHAYDYYWLCKKNSFAPISMFLPKVLLWPHSTWDVHFSLVLLPSKIIFRLLNAVWHHWHDIHLMLYPLGLHPWKLSDSPVLWQSTSMELREGFWSPWCVVLPPTHLRDCAHSCLRQYQFLRC